MPPKLNEDPAGVAPAAATSIGKKRMNQNLICAHRARTPRRTAKPAAVVMLEILLATTLTLATLTVIVRPKEAADPSTSSATYYGAVVERSKWDMVASEFTGMGIYVRPYNADRPNLMAATLRPGVTLTHGEAQKIATGAVSMLGPFALVTLRDSSGQKLALGYGLADK